MQFRQCFEWAVLIHACCLLLIVSQPSWGDTYQPKIELGPFAGNLKVGPKMVATGHRLWNTEIVGQDLRGACFDDCDLGKVAIRQCDLRGATFRRAVLTGMVIDDCKLGDNDFALAVINGLLDSDVGGDAIGLSIDQLKTTWSFQNRDLSDCKVSVPRLLDLSKFKLQRTIFYDVDFTTTRFDDAVFHEIAMYRCTIDISDFRKAGGSLSMCTFQSCVFQGGADFSSAFLSGSIVGQPSGPMEIRSVAHSRINGITASDWLDSNSLKTTDSYLKGCLVNCRFIGNDFRGTDFGGQLMFGTVFNRTNLEDCNFDDAVVTGADFRCSQGLAESQIMATWNYKHGRMAQVRLPDHLKHLLQQSLNSKKEKQ